MKLHSSQPSYKIKIDCDLYQHSAVLTGIFLHLESADPDYVECMPLSDCYLGKHYLERMPPSDSYLGKHNV